MGLPTLFQAQSGPNGNYNKGAGRQKKEGNLCAVVQSSATQLLFHSLFEPDGRWAFVLLEAGSVPGVEFHFRTFSAQNLEPTIYYV